MANAFIDEYELKIGDIACFICPNSHLQAIGLLSVLAAGGVCVFLNEKSTYGMSLRFYYVNKYIFSFFYR
jgi:hypothetical protein